MASFLYSFPYKYRFSNYCDSYERERAITLERDQRTDTKKDAKRIKSDNFTMSNKKKSNTVSNIFADCTIHKNKIGAPKM